MKEDVGRCASRHLPLPAEVGLCGAERDLSAFGAEEGATRVPGRCRHRPDRSCGLTVRVGTEIAQGMHPPRLRPEWTRGRKACVTRACWRSERRQTVAGYSQLIPGEPFERYRFKPAPMSGRQFEDRALESSRRPQGLRVVRSEQSTPDVEIWCYQRLEAGVYGEPTAVWGDDGC